MARAWRAAALLLLNTLFLLAVAEGLAAAILWWTGPRPGAPVSEADRAAQVLSDDLDRLTVDYWPHVGWRAHPLRSRTLNVDDGGNRVTPGAACEAGVFTVFVFGGSSVFGYGVADADTLPARLHGALTTRLGRPVCLRNFGQFGWSSTQGVIALLRELQERPAPELVVFYDGFNDVNILGDDGVGGGAPRGAPDYDGAVAVARADRHGAVTALLELLRSSHLWEAVVRWRRAWRPAPSSPAGDQPPVTTPDAIVRAYITNVEAVRAIAGAHGFQAAFFWQPTLWVKAGARTADEQRLLADGPVRQGAPALLQATYPLVAAEAGRRAGLFYLGDIFDTTPAPTPYLDECHLTPAGNAAVAARIAGLLGAAGMLDADRNRSAGGA
jgi:hypothetical protein